MSDRTDVSPAFVGSQLRLAISVILAMICPTKSADAQGPGTDEEAKVFTCGFEADVVSAYLWHNLEITRTPVGYPWLWVSAFGFTLSAWGTKDFSGSDYDDAELILEYEGEWGAFTISPMLEWYFYPFDDNSGELTVKLKYPINGTYGFYTKQSVFLWGVPGDYAGEIGFAFDKEFSDVFSMAAETGLMWASPSFNDNNCDVARWGLDVWGTEIIATWYPVKFLYVCPHAGLSVVLDRELQQSTVALPVAGLTAGVEF